ncbi:alpha/beta hydrolase family protein [Clavibacter michiganensis]|uniref:alpha/beta hydrolase family protein n=1 Tax=Clavibacter michiganensis TaxID=28447 RepID=UPI00130D9182|nr:alpha/beta fold hydrolase [Clavibacter michiganensis]
MRLNRVCSTVALAILGAGVAAVIPVLRIFGRKIVGLTPDFTPTRVVDWHAGAGVVRLELDSFTRAQGEYRVWWDQRRGHAGIGGVLAVNDDRRTVDRELLDVYGVAPRSRVEWTGQVHVGPEQLGLPWSEVAVETELGPAPAWYFPGEGTTWVVHIHGIRVSRLSPLRGVPLFARLGHHSLVISYRGDGDGPPAPGAASMLGLTEWRDVEAAIDHALAHGAGRIILVGWSLGGGMALLASERARNRGAITGMVLVAPATSWRETILHGARASHVPAWLGRSVITLLGSRRGSRILGGADAIDFDALDWSARPDRVRVPTLVMHSPDDDEIPIELSRRFASLNPSVDLVELPGAFHTLEWNRDPKAFDGEITSWVRRLVEGRR